MYVYVYLNPFIRIPFFWLSVIRVGAPLFTDSSHMRPSLLHYSSFCEFHFFINLACEILGVLSSFSLLWSVVTAPGLFAFVVLVSWSWSYSK
jgi:hypothetical protein